MTKLRWPKVINLALMLAMVGMLTVILPLQFIRASPDPGWSEEKITYSNLEKLKIKEIESKTYAFKSLAGNVIEIGMEKHSPPNPYLKLNRWDGECYLKLNIPFIEKANPILSGNKVKYSSAAKKTEVEFYPREPEEIVEKGPRDKEHRFRINEQGGVEFDTILYEKPETNKVAFPIETQGLNFYYQPPLHPEHPTWADENGDGIADTFRSDNVVGSYAVYHKSKQGDYSKLGGKNYKAGKAFHIYRPKVKDAQGNEIWADLDIDEAKGTLKIAIDQSWLDLASYPVVIDPNFGYETIGGSTTKEYTEHYIYGLRDAPVEDGIAESISIWIGAAAPKAMKCALYRDSDDSLIGSTGEKTSFTYEDWNTFNFTDGPFINGGTDYYISHWANYDFVVAYDSYTDCAAWRSEIYGAWLDPIAWDTEVFDRKHSIYCTYTPAYKIINLPAEISAIEEDTGEDCETQPQTGTHWVLLKRDGNLTGKIQANFTADIDLSNLTSNIDISAKKSVLYRSSWPGEIETSKTLYIPCTNSSLGVYICLNATNLGEVSYANRDFTLSLGQTKSGVTLQSQTITKNGQEYYEVTGITGTGGGENPPPTPVGGTIYRVNKFKILAPWIGLFAILASVFGVVIWRLRQRRASQANEMSRRR